MINIVVWSDKNIEIESNKYHIETHDDMIALIKAILDKAYYSGERLCLEKADIDSEQGKAFFQEIERWS